MKKTLALILALCMCLGMIVSVSAATPFAKRLNLVRLIHAMFAADEKEYEFGEYNDSILTLYVSPNGKSDADGTEKKPFSSIEAARDAIRTIDKSELSGIDIILASGTYKVDATIAFTDEDAGTKDCPIRYIGEGEAVISGGISFNYTEFEKASGDTLKLFPEEVQDKLYMYDLGKLGYTADDIKSMLGNGHYYNQIGLINVNGEQMDIARYPNKSEGWIAIDSGYFIDTFGNRTPYTDNDDFVDESLQAFTTMIKYGEEHMERVLSWKNREDLFVMGRYNVIWCQDNTEVITLYEDRDEMLVPYSGGYEPREGGLLYFYNIPEELDVPGEYYVDHNAILYYYPLDTFETDVFTVPTLADTILKVNGADWLTFENLTLNSTLDDGIIAFADNLTIKNCTVYDIYGGAVECEGSNITVTGCSIYNVGGDALCVYGGDIANLEKCNNLVCNNYINNWSTRGVMCWGIDVAGCGITVCHNEVGNSDSLGVCASGPYHTVEYNYIYDTNKFFCDGGALNTHSRGYGTVLRYNVIIGTGYVTDLDITGVAGIISDGTSGNEIHGNIIYNTTGDSLLAAGIDRDTIFHHNLCIKPGREGLEMNCPEYAGFYNANVAAVANDVEDYLFSEVWQTAFPQLKGIHKNYDPENCEDPMFFYAPVGNKAYSNYLIYDKAYETYPPMYDHKQGSLFDIENHVETFCDEDIERFSILNNNLEQYTSRRNKNPSTIGEALARANEAVGIIMTPEQLNEVGRIGVEYNIGDILVQ